MGKPCGSRLAAGMLAAGLALSGQTQAQDSPVPNSRSEIRVAFGHLSSERLEKDLQALSWQQFKSVVEAVPQLKADVDAYGPLGWQYVQLNYRNYPWRKNIEKLHGDQRQRLADLIGEAKRNVSPSD